MGQFQTISSTLDTPTYVNTNTGFMCSSQPKHCTSPAVLYCIGGAPLSRAAASRSSVNIQGACGEHRPLPGPYASLPSRHLLTWASASYHTTRAWHTGHSASPPSLPAPAPSVAPHPDPTPLPGPAHGELASLPRLCTSVAEAGAGEGLRGRFDGAGERLWRCKINGQQI
jgi:hypothetical protein